MITEGENADREGPEMNPRWVALPEPANVAAVLSELRARNALLRGLLKSLPVALLAWDWEQQQVLFFNTLLEEFVKPASIHDPSFEPLSLFADRKTRESIQAFIERGFTFPASELRLRLPKHDVWALTVVEHLAVAGVQAVAFYFLNPQLARTTAPPTTGDELEAFLTLTPREVEILRLLSTGRTNDAIARALGLTVGTVKNYVSSIYVKLRVGSRGEAIVRARDLWP